MNEEAKGMKGEFKKRWVEALRSGKYEQCLAMLRCDNSFCCLGVACDVLDPKGWQGKRWANTEYTLSQYARTRMGLEHLDSDVQIVGLVPRDTKFGSYVKLTELNDAGFTFPQIADVIEHFL